MFVDAFAISLLYCSVEATAVVVVFNSLTAEPNLSKEPRNLSKTSLSNLASANTLSNSAVKLFPAVATAAVFLCTGSPLNNSGYAFSHS